jgi:hypothetical protein
MRHHVILSFGRGNELELDFSSDELVGRTASDAHRWFAREFEALDCPITNPIGKVLLADLIISVARDSGEARFREHPDWARDYARNAAVLLQRDLIRVDIPNATVGY